MSAAVYLQHFQDQALVSVDLEPWGAAVLGRIKPTNQQESAQAAGSSKVRMMVCVCVTAERWTSSRTGAHLVPDPGETWLGGHTRGDSGAPDWLWLLSHTLTGGVV